MNDPTKWWLISEESIKIIGAALTRLDDSEAILELDSGLHITCCIPEDYKNESNEADKYYKWADEIIDWWIHNYFIVQHPNRKTQLKLLAEKLRADIPMIVCGEQRK